MGGYPARPLPSLNDEPAEPAATPTSTGGIAVGAMGSGSGGRSRIGEQGTKPRSRGRDQADSGDQEDHRPKPLPEAAEGWELSAQCNDHRGARTP